MQSHYKNDSPKIRFPEYSCDLNRREFLSIFSKAIFYTSCTLLGVPLYYSCSYPTATGKQSLVSIIRSENVWDNNRLDRAIISAFLNQGIQRLTGYSDYYKAWNSLFTKNDRVAIKVNCIGRNTGSTKPELTYTVAQCLHNYVHIPLENITIFDRTEHELIGAGYTINQSTKGIKVIASYSHPFSQKMKRGEIDTSLTSIITKQCTALINLSLLKTHPGAGISLSLKNHYGSIPKEIVQDNKLGYHSKNFKNMIYLNSLPPIKDKTCLYIIDSLIGQYNLGPQGDPNYQWKYSGLIMGTDPVAVDTIGLDVINKKRQENNLHPLKIKHLKWAEEEGLGTHDRRAIELVHTTA